MTTVHRTVPPPPRRAVWSAWAIPLLVLPSALWRAGKAFDDARGLSAVTDGGWYLLLLSVLALSLLSPVSSSPGASPTLRGYPASVDRS